MKLTDRELEQVASGMYDRLCSRETYFTKGDVRVFNNALDKIRIEATGRKNERAIRRRLGDTVNCPECDADWLNGKKCDCEII